MSSKDEINGDEGDGDPMEISGSNAEPVPVSSEYLPQEFQKAIDTPIQFSKERISELQTFLAIAWELCARAKQMKGDRAANFSREHLNQREIWELMQSDARFEALFMKHSSFFSLAIDGGLHDDPMAKSYLEAFSSGNGDPEKTMLAVAEAHNKMGMNMARKLSEVSSAANGVFI